jgi:DMSO/TMAO reductase YedYZ molybdopterin-dependent catalytic subunit
VKRVRRPSLLLGAILGGLSSLPLIAIAYLGEQWAGLPFVPFDLFDWLARVLPGEIITRGIDTIVRLVAALGLGPTSVAAKHIEQLLGLCLVVIGGVLVGLVVSLLLRDRPWPGSVVGAGVGLVVFLLVGGVEAGLALPLRRHPVESLLWLAILIIGWGGLLGMCLTERRLAERRALTAEARAARRTFLGQFVGGCLGIALVAWGLARAVGAQERRTGAGQPLSRGGSAAGSGRPAEGPGVPLPEARMAEAIRDRVPPAPGTRPEITPTPQFYRVDIDTRPPRIDAASWAVQVSGLFDHPRPLRMADFLAYPAVSQPITLCCISNPVGGDLIGTTIYTGVPLRVVLRDLGLKPEARALEIHSADGFFETVTLEDMLDPRTLLVYGMNGVTLPAAHGYPLRIYIPNHYGMKQPKWVTAMEAVSRPDSGYWVDRSWSRQARPQILSIIDSVAVDHIQNGKVPVGGIAWAGDRGIRKVEVQVDSGPWAEAVLRTPPLSPLTWVQWVYAWPRESGRHTFRVRATDGTGALQIEASHGSYPDGATGYHSVTVTI